MTTPTKQSKLREILKKEYVKTAILIIILIGGMLFFFFGVRVILRTETPFMTVVSGSMIPTLNIGDLIVVQYVDPSTIYAASMTHSPPGDILVFLHWDSSEGLISLVHRAVRNETDSNGKRYLITLGDANHGATDTHRNITAPHAILPGLPEEYVIGKVIANVPFIGQILLSLQTPSGRIIIIVLVVALLIVEFIPFSKKKNKEQLAEPDEVKA